MERAKLGFSSRSSVSSKQPVDENDGVWRKQGGPPTEWLINLRAEQPSLLDGTEWSSQVGGELWNIMDGNVWFVLAVVYMLSTGDLQI